MSNNPFIQNVSFHALEVGFHEDPGPNAILIQIGDPGDDHPTPKHKFAEVHKFQFHDLGSPLEGYIEMQQLDAEIIVSILSQGLRNKQNVIVNCHAGLCRSGAVAEIGVIMGYSDTNAVRVPNAYMKSKLMKIAFPAYYYDTE